MSLRKNLVGLFITFVVSFGVLMNAAVAASSDELQQSLTEDQNKEEITIKDVDGMKVVTFNPKVNKMRVIAAKEQGLLEGERVDVIAKSSNAIIAMNGGFFTEGERSASPYGRMLGKFISKTYSYTGIAVGTNYAFPSAIQKVNNKLLSDTSNYLPALGISDSGDIKIGEVKVVWSATRFENGKKFILDRISDIDSHIADAVIYYKDGLDMKEIYISNSKVSHVAIVAKVDKGAPNCYQLHEPSEETIDEFNSLKVGDYLSCGYELEAAAYSESEQAGTKDPELSSSFNNCPYVVSGGQLLINEGRVDPRISKDYGRGVKYAKFGTAVCLRKDGMASLIVKPGDLPSDEFVERLIEEKCEYAISLDGGGSTTLVTKDGDEVYGFNRVVSDIIAVMPAV